MKINYIGLFFYIFLQHLFHCYNSDAYKTFTEYLESYSYPFEEHFLTTSDSYILRLFRVQSKTQPKIISEPSGKVLLMIHGLADSSDTYIVNKEEWAPALFFANKNHDVWLGNVRGNKHSRNHTNLNPNKDKAFWDFSMDEMVDIDVPEMCAYIYGITQKKINYIGHSQGSTLILAALAEKNEIVLKTVEKILALGPVVFLQEAKKINPLKAFVNNPIIETMIGYLQPIEGEVLFPDLLKNTLVNAICPRFKSICDAGFESILELMANIDPKVDYMKRSEVFMTHYPGGTSLKAVMHWYQNLKNEKEVLTKFDYGPEGNMERYGKSDVKIYDFGNIGNEVKIFLYIGYFDRVGTKGDILKLKEMIKSKNVFHKTYPLGHSSFVWGKEVTYFLENVNDDLIECSCKEKNF